LGFEAVWAKAMAGASTTTAAVNMDRDMAAIVSEPTRAAGGFLGGDYAFLHIGESRQQGSCYPTLNAKSASRMGHAWFVLKLEEAG
jgi:hypothetical protein